MPEVKLTRIYIARNWYEYLNGFCFSTDEMMSGLNTRQNNRGLRKYPNDGTQYWTAYKCHTSFYNLYNFKGTQVKPTM